MFRKERTTTLYDITKYHLQIQLAFLIFYEFDQIFRIYLMNINN